MLAVFPSLNQYTKIDMFFMLIPVNDYASMATSITANYTHQTFIVAKVE